ncbi:monooxygenase [Haliangium sp.]|uniref:monooxygenase n=1 Tax=Haliangium sp. TaxID=2663208 RepID=UPI003D1186F9
MTIAAAGLVSSLVACGGGEGGPAPGALTYFQDVKPIIDAKCTGCHFEGGIAPMALTGYDDVSANVGFIKVAVETGEMPPWHAADDCNQYFAARALDEAQKATLLDWIDEGAAEGDPANEAPPIEVEVTTLSRVDTTLTMPVGYVPISEPDKLDDYRCFIVPWPETETKYVTGFRARPGNDAVAHHVIAFLAPPDQTDLYMGLDAAEDGPGWTCFGGTGGPPLQWVGAWVPGNQGSDLSEGLGIEVEPGSLIILQMHYNTANVLGQEIEPDRTRLDFRLEDQVAKPARILPWTNRDWFTGAEPMSIPAGEPDVMHSFSGDPTDFPFTGASRLSIHNVGLHMHLLGTSGRLSIERADGSSSCLLQIDDWDFDWQADYVLRQPITFDRGDALRLECHWDNSADNQPFVGGAQQAPSDVGWGDGSSDEMCLGILLVTAE